MDRRIRGKYTAHVWGDRDAVDESCGGTHGEFTAASSSMARAVRYLDWNQALERWEIVKVGDKVPGS